MASHISKTVLAHTLTTLLDLARTSSDPQLRTLSLEALKHLFHNHLGPTYSGNSSLIAQFLPGVMSTLCRIVTGVETVGGKRSAERSVNLELTVQVMEEAIVGSISDVSCSDALAERNRKAGLVERLEDLEIPSEVLDPDADRKPTIEPTVKSFKTAAWVSATAAQLHLALISVIVPLRQHYIATVRKAFALLCQDVLLACSSTLEKRTQSLLINELVILSQDDWPVVSAAASTALRNVPSAILELPSILESALSSLPQTIFSHGDEESRMLSALRLLSGASQALSAQYSTSQVKLARFDMNMEKWSWSLLNALELARLPLHQPTARAQSNGEAAAFAWISAPPTLRLIESADGHTAPFQTNFPLLSFRHIPSSAVSDKLFAALAEIGSAFALLTDYSTLVIDHFMFFATENPLPAVRASAWWILCAVLTSPAKTAQTRRPKAHFRRTIRRIIKVATDCEVADLPEAGLRDADMHEGPLAESTNLVTVERKRGTNAVSTLLDKYKLGSTEGTRLNQEEVRASHRIVCRCLSLRCISIGASILGTDFRSELLASLYVILSYLGLETHPVLRDFAEVTLEQIAYHSGYASVSNLILDNVDYIINAVSQRLTLVRLDPQAPMVLVAVIRLVGTPIAPMVRDIVDEIFDALDSFHLYDEVCASLLAVLDALLKSMNTDVLPEVSKPGHRKLITSYEEDIAEFVNWYNHEFDDKATDDLNVEGVGRDATGAFTFTAPVPEEEAEEVPPPASKTEKVASAILGKSLYFLSHSSPFLRARVLNLITSGLPILASEARQSDLLPMVNKAWPYILNRLSATEENYVVLEAAALTEGLARYTGDFMSRRVLKEAWPRLRQLLVIHEQNELKSFSTGRTSFGSTHRLYRSIMGCMRYVVAEVLLDEETIWDLIILFRRFLDSSVDSELKNAAIDLYEQLTSINPDAVWLALSGASGLNSNLPQYLALPGLDLETNVKLLIDRMVKGEQSFDRLDLVRSC